MNKKEIETLLDATPYNFLTIGNDDRTLLFLKDLPGGRRILHALDTQESLNLEDAKQILDEDFSKRTFFNFFYSKISKKLYIESDHGFDEILNLYEIKEGEMKQITKAPYLGVFGINRDETLLAYASRHGKDEGGYLSTFKLRNLESGEEETLFEDKDFDYRLGWGLTLFSPDNQKLVISCDYKSQRRRNNFFLFDRVTKELRELIPEEHQVAGMMLLKGTMTNDGFAFVSDKEGADSIYWQSFDKSIPKKIFSFDCDSHSFRMSSTSNRFAISLAKRKENISKIIVLEVCEEGAKLISEKDFEGTVDIQAFNEDLWLLHRSFTTPNLITRNKIDGILSKVFNIPYHRPEVEKFLGFDYEYVEYESFDGKMVSAFLTLPRGEIKAAYLISFYGGSNYFSKSEAIFAKNGIACLSPAVRGSWEYGKEWRDLIKGDLGGHEMLDLIWGARFLEKRLGLKNSQIGISGGSHGGYATLRALTFPKDFNGYDSNYDWAFGICSAGFADLVKFYELSNIPDWLDDMLGSIDENIEKYKERSPYYCFDRLKAPVMIQHGTNDARVPYGTMEDFVEKLKTSDIPHEIMIKEGSGHNYSSSQEEAEVYAREIKFILEHTLI